VTISKALQRALLNSRNARLERFVRAGAGFFSPQKAITTTGWGQASPLTAAEKTRPVLIVTSFEWIGPGLTDYPSAPNIFHTGFTRLQAGGLNNELVLSDVTGFQVPLITLSMYQLAPVGGVHYIAVLLDPVGDRCAIWFDGDQVGQAAFGVNTLDAGFIAYLARDPFNDPGEPQYSNIGTVGPLEFFPGFVPPTFVF